MKAAREMTKDRFEAVLTKDYGQHFEKVVLMPPVCVDEWDAVVEMVMLAEDCSRPKAIEKIIDLVKSEYAARYKLHRQLSRCADPAARRLILGTSR